MRRLRVRVRVAVEKLIGVRSAALLAALIFAVAVPALASAQQKAMSLTGKPGPSSTPWPLPKTPLHTEFLVQTNGKGQVVTVKSGKSSANPTFNAQTYGNALQTFIRKPDGSVTIGVYRLSYDFNPKNGAVKREVSLVSRGGDPNAQSAVDWFKVQAEKRAEKDRLAAEKKAAAATPLPDLGKILASPAAGR